VISELQFWHRSSKCNRIWLIEKEMPLSRKTNEYQSGSAGRINATIGVMALMMTNR